MWLIIRSLRPFNLIIVGATQLLFYFLLFAPLTKFEIALSMHPTLIFWFTLCTIVISASGYVINDYFDIDSDKINHKDKSLNDPNSLLIIYYSLMFAGLLIAFGISYQMNKLALTFIYLVATSILYLYSAWFKSIPLTGNIIVAAFSSAVFLILFAAEVDAISLLKSTNKYEYNELLNLMIFFGFFAFSMSLFREIVKDIQDIEGDRQQGLKTFPVVFGIERSKILAGFVGIILFFSLVTWAYYSGLLSIINFTFYYFIFALLVPLSYLIYKTIKFSDHKEFAFSSQASKIIMILGLILIMLIKWI